MGQNHGEPIPATGGITDGADDFWINLSQYTADDWQRMIAYLWRCEPITDRRGGGKPTSIAKLGRPFDVDDIMKNYGSGVYRIDVCQILPNGNQQKRILQHYERILNLDFPPRVPYGDWIDDPVNAQWKWSGPKLQQSEAGPNPPNGSPATSDPSTLFTTVLNGVRAIRGEMGDNGDLAGQVIEMLRDSRDEVAKLNNPATQIETLTRLIALVRPNDNVRSSSEAELISFLRDEMKAQREEIAELRKAQAQPKTLLEQLNEVKEIGKILNPRGAGANGGTDWGDVIGKVADKLSGPIVGLIGMLNGPKPGPAAGVAGAPAAVDTRGNVWPAAAASIPPPATAAATVPQMPMGPDGVPYTPEQIEREKQRLTGILQKHGEVIQQVAPFVMDYFRAGHTGYDFRDWFIDRLAPLRWSELKADVSAEDLAALSELHPVLASVLKPRERVIQFFTEFFTEQGKEPEGTYDEADPDKTAGVN